ncbi:GalK Galactokinase [Fimbriimonadaceae bacterium]
MALQAVSNLFHDQFGTDPSVVSVAPGRVNLIGEHTDYNEGFVFPAAIDRETWVAASLTEGETSVVSLQTGPGHSFFADRVEPGNVHGWARYIAGMAWAFREIGILVPDAQFAVSSNIPMGSGVSSSAALEMAIGTAWLALIGRTLTPSELAIRGQRCENGFVGVQSGIMDQMASANGRAGQAMFLDTRSLEITYAPIPSEWKIVLLETGKARALTKSAYNERRSACEAVAAKLGAGSLRDVSLEDLEANRDAVGANYPRAKHVVTENIRTLEFVDALRTSDTELVGSLMRESHESLRDDYEVSCPELDAMVEAAWITEGGIGARLTGAGFGGACVALVHQDHSDQFSETVIRRYQEAIGDTNGYKGNALVCGTVEGARITLSRDAE